MIVKLDSKHNVVRYEKAIKALPSGDRTALLGFGVEEATTPRQRLSLLQLFISELQAECLLTGVAPTPIRAPAPVPARLRGALGALSASLRAGPVAGVVLPVNDMLLDYLRTVF